MSTPNISILEEPKLPAEIRKAVDEDRLAVFVGAGVSRLMGCAGWDDLATKLIEKCFTSTREDGDRFINCQEKQILKDYKDCKNIITICHQIFSDENALNRFYEEFGEALEPKPDKEESAGFQDMYEILYGIHGIFLTTNVDGLFAKFFNEDQIVHKFSDLDPVKLLKDLKRDKLYCIHGDLERDKASTVFTVDKYIEQYSRENFRAFLQAVFSENTVLFIGYGMSEFEVLDYLLGRSGSQDGPVPLKHFLLEGYHTVKENLVRMNTKYYVRLGVKVVPYALDTNSYGQLYTVLKGWGEQINSVSSYQHDVRSEIQSLVDSSSDEDILRALQLISIKSSLDNRPSLELELFRALSEHDDPLPWLAELDKNGYLSAEKNPAPREDSESPGSLFTDNWPVLWYLKNLAKVNSRDSTEKVTTRLLKFINDTVSHKENGERIQNWITDNSAKCPSGHQLSATTLIRDCLGSSQPI